MYYSLSADKSVKYRLDRARKKGCSVPELSHEIRCAGTIFLSSHGWSVLFSMMSTLFLIFHVHVRSHSYPAVLHISTKQPFQQISNWDISVIQNKTLKEPVGLFSRSHHIFLMTLLIWAMRGLIFPHNYFLLSKGKSIDLYKYIHESRYSKCTFKKCSI